MSEWTKERIAGVRARCAGWATDSEVSAMRHHDLPAALDEIEQAHAEREALAAQLAEARAALERFTTFAWSGVTVSWDKKTRSSEAEAYLMSHVNNARDVLAKPAPRAELIAAAVKLAEAYCGYIHAEPMSSGNNDRWKVLLGADALYVAAKEAAK
jgi:hypothetical protein